MTERWKRQGHQLRKHNLVKIHKLVPKEINVDEVAGYIGPTGPTGPTGVTGPTGPTGSYWCFVVDGPYRKRHGDTGYTGSMDGSYR